MISAPIQRLLAMRAARPTPELVVEWTASGALGGALTFAVRMLAPAGTPSVSLVAALGGVAGFVLAMVVLRSIPAPHPRRALVAPRAWPVDLREPADAPSEVDELLELTMTDMASPRPSVEDAVDGDDLLLDASMVADRASSTVVALFDQHARNALPSAAELASRIDRHLETRDAPATVVPLAPASASGDADDALSAALADLRQSLRGAGR